MCSGYITYMIEQVFQLSAECVYHRLCTTSHDSSLQFPIYSLFCISIFSNFEIRPMEEMDFRSLWKRT